MARVVSRRGRMRSVDEMKIQVNTVFIENEVDGKDLAGSLYSCQLFDCNDRDEILAGRTRLDRTRRLIDILLLRGPSAFEVFLEALDTNGYSHVALQLKETELSHILFEGDSASSLFGEDRPPSPSSLKRNRTSLTEPEDRLKKIEDAWQILSRRVTRIETNIEYRPDLPEDEIIILKGEIQEIKEDTLKQVQELTDANFHKAEMVKCLAVEVEEKTKQLEEAQEKIESLERRIAELEEEKSRSFEEVSLLRSDLDTHRETVAKQGELLEEQAKSLQKQEGRLVQQDRRIKDQDRKLHDLQAQDKERARQQQEHRDELIAQREMVNILQHTVELMAANNKQTNAGGSTSGDNPSFCVSGNNVRNTAKFRNVKKVNTKKFVAYFPSN